MPSSPTKLDDVRATFLSTGILDDRMQHLVRPVVLESWKRSRLLGSKVQTPRLPFESPIVSDSVLLRAARPILANLSSELGMDHASLLVADRHARILQTWSPDKEFSRRMERIGSVAGHSGAEEDVGTNGIGTMVTAKRAGMIVGAEHLSDVLSDFACVGAPIFNPINSRFQGVVTLTALVQDANPILSGLISRAAREVGQQMLNLSSMRERVLFDSYLVAARRGRPIAVVGGDILMENPAAMEYLRLVDKNSLWLLVSEAVSVAHPERTIHLDTEDARTELACSAVVFDDEVIGAIIEVVGQRRAVEERPPRAVASTWSPLSESLPGISQAWVYAREQAESAMKALLPVVVFGAPGSGKFTLVKHMLDRLAPKISPGVFDAHDARTDAGAWLDRISAALVGETPVVLRHLDLLDSDTAQDLAERIIASPALLERGWVHGTAAAQGVTPPSPGHQALLDVLAVGRIDMPNLRERRQDMRLILRAIEREYAPNASITYTQGAFTALSRAPWPGNLRQLDSVMRGVFALGRGNEVTIDRLPPAIAAYARRRDLTMLEQLELDGIMNALIRCEGNKVLTAEMLGISRSTLYRKISGYKLDEERLFL